VPGVVLAPTATAPARNPRSSIAACSALRHETEGLADERLDETCRGGGAEPPRPARSNSGTPKNASSPRRCSETAVG